MRSRSAASEHPNKTESRLDTDLGNLDIDFLKLDMDLGNLDMGFPQEMNLRKISLCPDSVNLCPGKIPSSSRLARNQPQNDLGAVVQSR